VAKRRRARGLSRRRLALLLAVAGLSFALGMFWARRGQAPGGPAGDDGVRTPPPAPAAPPPAPSRRRELPPAAPAPPGPARPAALAPVAAGQARIALVIDDLGRSVADVGRVESLHVPWTGAVLPFESQTAEVAAALRTRGIEYLCHLPMQAANGDPGPGALLLDMTPAQLARTTGAALDAVPGAAGVNNHMGSVLSADEGAMGPILAELAARGLFFIDSRTSPASVGYRLALAHGVAAAERQVFLDADPAPEAVALQFERLLGLARERGAAVAIGHPHRDTLSVLEREIPRALAAGYEFVPASYLLDTPATTVEH